MTNYEMQGCEVKVLVPDQSNENSLLKDHFQNNVRKVNIHQSCAIA